MISLKSEYSVSLNSNLYEARYYYSLSIDMPSPF